jgi:UDPglucose--hexose-1-phosphate uridylyltransferase
VDASGAETVPIAADDLFQQPHRRYDPLRDDWVLVSPGRTSRPWQGSEEPPASPAAPAYDPTCYLCPDNVRASGEHNPPYTGTFAFTNDFAALRPLTSDRAWGSGDGVYVAHGQQGTCRVVCFSPRHDLSLAAMSQPDVRGVVDMWADQTAELGERYRWVQVFENRGAAMGASNRHPHGQIWAGTTLPSEAAREDRTQQKHLRRAGTRLLSAVAAAELGGPRVVERSARWLAIVPFWAIWPFEILLLPLDSIARLTDLDASQRDDLATILTRVLSRYDRLFGVPFPYSMGWHGAPFEPDAAVDAWQVHAHFYPPLLRSATVRKFMVGYELLAEPQRDITPEDAAALLRSPAYPS